MFRFLVFLKIFFLLSGESLIATGLFLQDNPQSKSGPTVYHGHCARCHGKKGEGSGTVTGLRETRLSREKMILVVNNGIPETTMSGWKNRLTETEISNVVDFILSDWSEK